jgi:hypothetical protein
MPAMTTRWQRYAAWAGWLVTCAPVFIVLSSARWKLTHNAWYVQEFGRIGWPVSALETLAAFQLTGIVLLLIPWTSVLGAIILTGYLGGAVATYLRIGEWYPPLVPFTTAVLAWLGLFLREPRLWVLLPFRRRS